MEDEIVDEVVITTDDVIEASEEESRLNNSICEIAEISDAIDSGEEEVVNLNAIANQLENTVPNGGAEPVSAHIAEIAVESIYRRLGITKPIIPAIENFNDINSRKLATEHTIKSIRDTSNKIEVTLEGFLEKLSLSVKALFGNVSAKFQRYEGMVKEIVANQDKIHDVTIYPVFAFSALNADDSDLHKPIAFLKYVNSKVKLDAIPDLIASIIVKAITDAIGNKEPELKVNTAMQQLVNKLGFKHTSNRFADKGIGGNQDVYINPNLEVGTRSIIITHQVNPPALSIKHISDTYAGYDVESAMDVRSSDIKAVLKELQTTVRIFAAYSKQAANGKIETQIIPKLQDIQKNETGYSNIGRTLRSTEKFAYDFNVEMIKQITPVVKDCINICRVGITQDNRN